MKPEPLASRPLTTRQQAAADLVERYVAVAHEYPSSTWLGRELSINRKRAWLYLDALRARGWCRTSRTS